MATLTLKARFVAGVKSETQVDYYDETEDGLILRVGPKKKTWAFRYRLPGGKRRRFKLGAYPAMSLAEARAAALDVRSKIENHGADPQGEKVKGRKTERADRFSDLANAWIADRGIHRRSINKDLRKLRVDILPAIGETPAKEVTRAAVRAVLDGIAARGSAIAAHRTASLISAIYNYGIAEELVEHNPATRPKRYIVEPTRDRVLSEAEIRALWEHSDPNGPEGPIIGGILRFALLTAARKTEVMHATWGEIQGNFDVWEIPGRRTKNGRMHRIPMSPEAREVLAALPRLGPWLFPSSHRVGPREDMRPTISRYYKREDMAALLASGVEPWGMHDLRRTCLTGLSKLRIPGEVRDACANHTARGVRAIYDRHDYEQEKLEALSAWGRHVVAIAEGKVGAEVVAIASRR